MVRSITRACVRGLGGLNLIVECVRRHSGTNRDMISRLERERRIAIALIKHYRKKRAISEGIYVPEQDDDTTL